MTTESGQPEEHILEEGVCLIGRSSESRVVLHDSLVSRQHAEINFDGKTVTLRGLGGKNPVRVNGRDIQDTEDYQLLNDDRITIGESELRFVFEDAGDKSRRLRVFKNSDDCETRVEDLSLDASAAVFGEKNAGTSEANYKRLSSLYRLTENILEIGDEETAYEAILDAVAYERDRVAYYTSWQVMRRQLPEEQRRKLLADERFDAAGPAGLLPCATAVIWRYLELRGGGTVAAGQRLRSPIHS